jgi:short-subunit dehydrogenase
VRVNCEAMVRLTRLFVPRMVERRRGWVLVLASTASFQPVPYITTYAATKAFDRFFALGLAAEVARFGVKVTALCPGPTESEFFDVARATAFKGRGQQPAADVARLAIAALAHGQRTLIPYFGGKFNALLVRFLPVRLITRFYREGRAPGSMNWSLAFRPHELVINHGQTRAGTPALQPARRPALHSCNYLITRSRY